MRNLFSVTVFVVALLALLLLANSGAAAAGARADADCSGAVDGQDALDILLTLSGASVDVPHDCAAVGSNSADGMIGDANCDRQIDARDVLDTLEIAGGVTVAPCYLETLAPTGAASQVIGADGGTLSATGPDGSTFSLEIPADALTGPQLIQMSPISAIAGLPFSGGFVAGVDLQPAGLLFWDPAVLTITPSTAVSADAETPFLLAGGALTNADVLPEAGPVEIPLNELSVAGIASATDSDRGVVNGQIVSSFDVYVPSTQGKILLSQARDHLRQARADELSGNHAGAQDELGQHDLLVTQYYNTEIAPNLQKATTDCQFASGFLPYALSWAKNVELQTGSDAQPQAVLGVIATMNSALVNCFNEAHTRCLNHDLTAIPDMLSYAHALALVGGDQQSMFQQVQDCARFRLEFDSDLCLAYTQVSPPNCPNIEVEFSAQGIEWGGLSPGTPEGQGPMSLVKAVGPQESATSDGSTFAVVSGGVYLNQIDQAGKPTNDPQVSIVIQPGQPTEHWSSSSGDFDANFWYNRFCAIHANELVGHPTANEFSCLVSQDLLNGGAQFRIDGWQKLGGELYAQRTYYRTYGQVSMLSEGGAQPQGGPPQYGWEITTLKLYHEPQ